MGPTGTDGGLRNGEKCLQKLTDSHCIEHWCCQTPGAVQSCGMSGVCGLCPLVSQRPRGRGSGLCQYASLSSVWHCIAVQAAMNLIVPAEGDAQGWPLPRPNSDVGAAAEMAADASSRPGSGSDGAAGPPASGPPKQRNPQRLAAGHPAGVSALISEAHRAVVTVVLQACCVPHALLSVPSHEAVQPHRDEAGCWLLHPVCPVPSLDLLSAGAALQACLHCMLPGSCCPQQGLLSAQRVGFQCQWFWRCL